MRNVAAAPNPTCTAISSNPVLYRKTIKFDAVKDFTAVSMLAQGALIFSVNPQVPARSARELASAVKANPKQYNFATSGNGSAGHLAGNIERRYAAGLIYTSGPFTAMAGYRFLQNGLGNPASRSNLYWLGGAYAIKPALTLRAGIYHTDVRASDDDAMSYTLQLAYNLSKRTEVYLNASYMDNKGRSTLGVASATRTAQGVGQTGAAAGIKHIF